MSCKFLSINIFKIIKVLFIMFFIILLTDLSFAGWIKINDQYKYLNEQTGQYVRSKWIQTNVGFYFLNAEGNMCKGWYQIGNDYYYFSENGILQSGFVTTDGNTYYLSANDGKMIHGWIEVDTDGVIDYYYFNDNGTMAVGWLQMNDGWHYFNEGKAVVNTWIKIQSYWYRFNDKGIMQTGWCFLNNEYYYLNPQNGRMETGFVQDNAGNSYYLKPEDGTLAINETIMINGIMFTFDNKGQLIKSNETEQKNLESIISNSFNTIDNTNTMDEITIALGISPGSNMSSTGINGSQVSINKNAPVQIGDTIGPR